MKPNILYKNKKKKNFTMMEEFERGLAKLGISQQASEEGSTADSRSRTAEKKGRNTDEAESMQWRSQPSE